MTDDPNTTAMPSAPPAKKGGKGCWLWGCGILLLLAIIGAVVMGLGGYAAYKGAGKNLEIKGAIDMAQILIKEQKNGQAIGAPVIEETGDTAVYQMSYLEQTTGVTEQLRINYIKNAEGNWEMQSSEILPLDAPASEDTPAGETMTTPEMSDDAGATTTTPTPVDETSTPAPAPAP